MTTEVPSNIERVEVQCDQQNPALSIAEDELPKYPRACPVPACEGKIFKGYHTFWWHWNSTHEKMITLRKCLISGKIIDGLTMCHKGLHKRNKKLYIEVFIPNDSYIDPGTTVPFFRDKQQLQNMGTNKTSESLVGDGSEVKREVKFDIAGRETDLLGSSNITDRETKEHLADWELEPTVPSDVIVRDSAGRYGNYCISLYTRIVRTP